MLLLLGWRTLWEILDPPQQNTFIPYNVSTLQSSQRLQTDTREEIYNICQSNLH